MLLVLPGFRENVCSIRQLVTGSYPIFPTNDIGYWLSNYIPNPLQTGESQSIDRARAMPRLVFLQYGVPPLNGNNICPIQ